MRSSFAKMIVGVVLLAGCGTNAALDVDAGAAIARVPGAAGANAGAAGAYAGTAGAAGAYAT